MAEDYSMLRWLGELTIVIVRRKRKIHGWKEDKAGERSYVTRNGVVTRTMMMTMMTMMTMQ